MTLEHLALAAASIFLCLLVAATLTAPLLTAHEPSRQHDPRAARLLPPGSDRYELHLADGRRFIGERLALSADALSLTRNGRAFVIDRRALAGEAPIRRLAFPLGTDHLGRDCLSRILHGGRLSLLVGLVASLASAALGSLAGALAALNPGVADATIMRLTDCALSFPPLVLLLVFLSLFEGGFTATVIFLAAAGWMPFARVVRAELRSVLESGFIEASVALGQTRTGIAVFHLLPHLGASISAAVTLRFAEVMILESSLAFLGLGIQAPAASWGRMIADGAGRLEVAWWLSLLPGALLFATVISITVVGDTLARRLDPRTSDGGPYRW